MLFFSLVILLFASGTDASCENVVTYSSKSLQELQCPITDDTDSGTWSDKTGGSVWASYEKGGSPALYVSSSEHNNFTYNVSASSYSLFIQDVQAKNEGEFVCTTTGPVTTEHKFSLVVEVLVKPTVQYESQDVDVLDVIVGTSYDLTCSATGARSVNNLSLMWDPLLVEKTPLSVTTNGDYNDYSQTSTYTAVRGDRSITCQLTGYAMQDEINDQHMDEISHTVNLNVRYAPVCNMSILEGEDCREVTLTCECEAVPAGITQYSFFNGSNNLNDGTSNTFTVLVAYGNSSEFSCSATNDIGPGVQTDAKNHKCDMPVESGGLATWAIVDNSFACILVVTFFVVKAVMQR